MRNLLRKMGKKRFNPGTAASMFFLNATDPQTINATPQGDDGLGLQGAARGRRAVHARPGDEQTARPPATHGQAAGPRAGDPLRQQEDAGQPAEEDGACAARHRGREVRADHPRPREGRRRRRSGVLFPGLRLGAAVLAGRPRDAGDAVARRRADGAAAGLPVLRLSAARRRRLRQGGQDHHRQPRAVPSRRQHAELSRHQDRRRQLRYLLRPARRLRIRQDLPRLPDHRHPRVPDGEGRQARQTSRGRGTCTTTPATRR